MLVAIEKIRWIFEFTRNDKQYCDNTFLIKRENIYIYMYFVHELHFVSFCESDVLRVCMK